LKPPVRTRSGPVTMRRLPAHPVIDPKVGETVGCDASSTALSPSSIKGAAAAGCGTTSVAGRSMASCDDATTTAGDALAVAAVACNATAGWAAVAWAGPEDPFGSQAIDRAARLRIANRGETDECSESRVMTVLYGTL